MFRDLPYAVINIAEMVSASRPDEAPLASAPSNVIHRGIVNSPDLLALESQTQDGILGKVKGPKFISQFIPKYIPTLTDKMTEIKKSEYVKISE